MKKTLHEAIEDYLDGIMDAVEKADFEARLKTEKTVAVEFSLIQTFRQSAAKKAASGDLKTLLGEVGRPFFLSELTEETAAETGGKVVELAAAKKRKWLWPTAFAMAASVAFLLFFNRQKADLYTEFRVFPPASFTEKSGDVSAEKAALAEAEIFFNQKKWAEADRALARAAAENAAPETLFFQALAKMEAGRTAEARLIFQKLRTEKTAFATDAAWFEALSFLKEGDENGCRKILATAAADDARAARLLEKLK